MSGGKGGENTTTVQQQVNPEALAAYHNAYTTGTNVAAQPYPVYDSPLIAGFTPMQTAGFQNINNAVGTAQPYFDQAAQLIQASTGGINPAATVDQFMSPYTMNVVNTLRDVQDARNAQARTTAAGSAISAGAFGGDRSAVQQGIMAREQGIADNAALAQALEHGYDTALSTGLTTQQANAYLANQGAYGLANLGTAAQSAALQGANAQLGAGNQQQQQAQYQLNVPYGQFQLASQYPFQTTNFLTGLAQAGNGAGSTQTQTTPGASPISQIAGLGLTGLGLWNSGAFGALGGLLGLERGGAVPTRARGGAMPTMPRYRMAGLGGLPGLPGFADGGDVDDSDYIPDVPVASMVVPPAAASAPAGVGTPYDTSIPRPRRLNNPGALKFAGQPGAINVDGFALFPTRDAGMAAADAQLGLYGSKHGVRTLGDAIRRWAPPNENDTDAYIRRVSQASGIDPDASIDLTDQSIRARILPHMFAVEEGTGAPDAGGPSPPPVAAPDQPVAGLTAPQHAPESGFRLNSPGMALLAAGLGILSGNSPNAAVNIGRGGLQGLGFVAQQQEAEAKREQARAEREALAGYRTATLDQGKQRMALEAARHQESVNLQRERLEQGHYTYQPWQQPDPNDPTKMVTGLMRTSTKPGEPPQFIPAQGQPVNKSDPTANLFNAGTAGDKHGDEYLKTLPPQVAEQVKALAEGRMQFPGSFALKTPYWQNVLSAVSQYDPSFDAVNYSARAATRKDFTSGKSAQNITAFNTAIGHLGTLAESAEKLANTWSPAWNSVANAVATATGDPRVKEFEIARNAVADELTRAFRGAGGAEAEVKRWNETLSAAGSPAQLRGAIKQGVDLLRSRINAIGDSYNRGMGQSQNPVALLSSTAQKTLERLDAIVGEKPAAAPPAASAAPGASPAPPPGGGRPIPDAAARDLKANPSAERKKQFDAIFGAGAADRLLGSGKPDA